jgi:AcrR family transcriptional regulator
VITPNNALTLSVDLTNSVPVLFDTIALMANTEAKDTSSARTIARQRRAREETAAKRRHLLECARIILREGSIFDLTAISLADQAGVTRQTVYRYFPNTETIFKALSDLVITQIYEDLQVANEGKDTLDHFVTKAMAVFVADSLVIRQLALASALGRASGRWQQVDPEGILVQIISDMPEERRPVSADPAISARMMITYFRGALYGWAAGFYSDEEFETQVRLASRLREPDSD